MTLPTHQMDFGFPCCPTPPRLAHRRTNNLFLAFKPPPAIANLMHSELQATPVWKHASTRIAAYRFHVSLLWLGTHPDPEPSFLSRIDRCMSCLAGEPIPVAFDRIAPFGGSAVVLRGGPVHAIVDLQRDLRGLLATATDARSRRHFDPHLTVCYSPNRFAEFSVKPWRWTAEEVLLVHSCSGHRTLARWPLTAAPASRVA